MHKNEELIRAFYTEFQQLNWQVMASCYDQDVSFSDPVFTDLSGAELVSMWHMLCSKADNFQLQFSDIRADDRYGAACWVATYTFSQTGRRVKNTIFAEFQFKNGKIIRHSDHFSFWRWSASALGASGVLLGWSGWFRRRVQGRAKKGLAAFMRRNASEQA